MKYRELGQTGINVSVICMGCWGIVGDWMWGSQEEKESIATIHTALASGINFFETAEAYGDGYSETLLGKALSNRRNEAIIATKVSRSNLQREDILRACEDSLKRLQTDYIDLYQIHWPSRTVPFEETMAALEELHRQGKIRAIGVSNFGILDLSEITHIGKIETNQLPYSLLWRAIEYQILKECVDQQIGVLCYSPLLHGLLTGKYTSPEKFPEGRARTRHFSNTRTLARHEEAGCEKEVFKALEDIRQIAREINQPMAVVSVSWLLHQAGITSVITGARKPEHIQGSVLAAELQLSSEVIDKLAKVTDQVKQLLGTNPDMWQSNSRYR